MSGDLMATLDNMRAEVGLPFIITAGFRLLQDQERLLTAGLTESTGSAHLSGEAVDGYFAGLPLSLQFAYACRWPFRGIGLYPYTYGTPPVLHLDVQDRGRPRTALWIRNRVGKYVYAPSEAFAHEWKMFQSEEQRG